MTVKQFGRGHDSKAGQFQADTTNTYSSELIKADVLNISISLGAGVLHVLSL